MTNQTIELEPSLASTNEAPEVMVTNPSSPSDTPVSEERRPRRNFAFTRGRLGDPPSSSSSLLTTGGRNTSPIVSPTIPEYEESSVTAIPTGSSRSSFNGNDLRSTSNSNSAKVSLQSPSALRNPGSEKYRSDNDRNNDFKNCSSSPRSYANFNKSSLHHGKVGGINGGGYDYSFSHNKHIEVRSKRLSTTRQRASSYWSNQDLKQMSVGDKAGYLLARVMGGFHERVPKRYRSATSIAALVGLVLIAMGFVSHPVIRKSLSPLAGTTSTRKLKDLAAAVIDSERVAPTEDFLDDFDQRRRRAADLPDGTVFSEPAHTRMCRAILSRLDAYDAGTTGFEQLIFTESEYVCRDPDAPYTSVMNMFAAQLLDVANNAIGLNVDYTHRCAKWERFCSGNMTTIQFHLPDPLSTKAYAFQPGCIDAPMLRTICAGCLNSGSTDPDCVLFPNGYLDTNTNTCNLGCFFRQVLPWIRNNLRAVATDWLNTVETRALTFWLRNAAEFSHREKDDMEVSVVALGCANEDCDMTMDTCLCEFTPLPNWVYALHIPRSSTNVAIVVSPTCAKFGDGCTLHAQELYHFLHSLYPRADITYNVITSTSSWYMRMITADHLVCPPGVGCLLPAIARDAYTYVYETTAPTVSTWLTCIPTDYLTRLTIPSFPPVFVQGDCRHLRARLGSWSSNMALAPSLQYSTPVDGYFGCADANFVPTTETPYRLPTTYQWDETIWATCPVDVMNKDELCTQMNTLGLRRILFVGDHTTMSQAISLASIVGQSGNISLDPSVVPNFSKTITCSSLDPVVSFQLSYIRNDRLEEPGTTPSPGNPNCGPTNEQYCYPWSSDYASYSGKQLLIVNTGYHWQEDWAGYVTNFQNFVGSIDEVAAANAVRVSLVFFGRR